MDFFFKLLWPSQNFRISLNLGKSKDFPGKPVPVSIVDLAVHCTAVAAQKIELTGASAISGLPTNVRIY